MALQACSLQGRPLPSPDDPEVVALRARVGDVTVIATDDADSPLGAVWCGIRERPLLRDARGCPLPELAMAVRKRARGRGVGTALLEAMKAEAGARLPELTLNVHRDNPAIRLYGRAGFTVARWLPCARHRSGGLRRGSRAADIGPCPLRRLGGLGARARRASDPDSAMGAHHRAPSRVSLRPRGGRRDRARGLGSGRPTGRGHATGRAGRITILHDPDGLLASIVAAR